MKKQNKNKKGFTLVEVIVVAVIVAILAAVAIPIYQQYVDDSGDDSAQNASGAIASFCGACRAAGGTVTGAPTTYAAGATITCTGPGTTIQVPVGVTAEVTWANPGNVNAVHVDGGTAAGFDNAF